MSEMRICPKCGRIKVIDEFYLDPAKPDGRGAWCKDCRYDLKREYLFRCEACGCEFTRPKKTVKARFHERGTLPRFCSKKCQNDSQCRGYVPYSSQNLPLPPDREGSSCDRPALVDNGKPLIKGDLVTPVTDLSLVGEITYISPTGKSAMVQFPGWGPARTYTLTNLRPHREGEAKRCTKCGRTKLLAEFPRDTRSSDGHGGWCKECKRASEALRRSRATSEGVLQ